MNRFRKTATVATLCIALVCLFVASGCRKDEKKEKYPIEIPVTEYTLPDFCNWKNLDYDEKVIVINSAEELEKYVSCTGENYPEFDFSAGSLLLLSGGTERGVSAKSQRLQQLSANQYQWCVEILLDETDDAEPWIIAVAASKQVNESTVELNVITSNVEEPKNPLRGTTWKLLGIVDVQTGDMKELEPKDCEYCFTLKFDSILRGYMYTQINDPDKTVIIGEDGNLINIDERLNNIFKSFDVYSYKFPFINSPNEYLRKTATIECHCDIVPLSNLLINDYSEHFSDVEVGTISPYLYSGIGVKIIFTGSYLINPKLSILEFLSASRPDAEDIYDGEIFNGFFPHAIGTFELKYDILKLYFVNKENYLLFNKKS